MTTIINSPPTNQTPAPSDGGGSNVMGTVISIIGVIIIIFLFVEYVLPALRGGDGTQTQEMDTNDNNGPTINVPDKIEVDIKGK